ncbi:SGNH/GDSL hydrolase family protein [Moorena sp. SIO4G3]|uniref:SGNH/GDSL hydrolase family protein n=1 Tax=Moorena sp. SIO4G3 TaxID=2607821 RepID=UPI00142D1761|nr:SGNH/GDSL hydrolase family protein [Moorena sp. SIO4G3]NEO80191.1 hypothetical protein [Moorena sp. SIO4G3]
MKPKLSPKLTLIAAYCISLLQFYTTAEAVTIDQWSLKIMPLGDSNTRGKALDRAGYRDDLWALFKDNGYRVNFVGSATSENPEIVLGQNNTYVFDKDHQGHGGFAIAGVGASNAWSDLNSEIEDWLKQARPDIVLLMAGTNDILFQNESPEDTVNEMILLIDKIIAWSDQVYLFVSSIPSINPSALQDGTIKNQKADKYNNLLANLLTVESYKNKNIRFIDNRNLFMPNDMLEDGIHLTPEGYKKLAQAWFKMMLGIGTREKQDDSPIDVPVEIEIYGRLEKNLQGKRIIKKLLIPDS